MSLRRALIALCLLGTPGFAAQPLNTTRSPDKPKSTKGAQLLSQRLTPESRELARLNAGFPANTQEAVDKTLHYLASPQSKDGSWGERKKIETTSLALLAFLGNGESPLNEKHGEAITASIVYLINSSAKQRGKLCTAPANPHHRWPLEHALATQALAESYLLCSTLGVHLPNHKHQIQNAAQLIIDGQTQTGGWALHFAEQSQRGAKMDLTVPILHALWLTHTAGIETRNMKPAVRSALGAIARRQIDTGEVQSHTVPVTGGAAFVYRIANRGNSEVVKDAMEFVRNSTFTYQGVPPGCHLLTLHYDALAVHNIEGNNQKKWFAPRITELLKNQHPSGQFNPQFDKLWVHPIEKAVALSSLACLILETPWRYHLNK